MTLPPRPTASTVGPAPSAAPELTATAATFHPLNVVHTHEVTWTPQPGDVFHANTPSAIPAIPADQDAEDGFAMDWSIGLGDDPTDAVLAFSDGTITLLSITLTPDVVTELSLALADVAAAQGTELPLLATPVTEPEYDDDGNPILPDDIPEEPSWERIQAKFNPQRWLLWFQAPENRTQRNLYIAAVAAFVFLAIIGLFN